MAGLKILPFREFVTLQRGFDLPKKDMKTGIYPVVGSTSIIGYHAEFKANPPGVVIGRSGSLGSVSYISEKYWPHNTSLWVRDFKGNIPRYVYYFLQTLKLQRYDSGAAVPTLNRNHLDSLELRIHNLSTQRKIAAILGNYDNLIENNTRRIKILEEMAGTIYREWFVEFRFPGHENVKMVESELGLIPQGWEVVTASEAISINPKTFVPRDTRKPFVPMKSATEHSILITEIEERTGNSGTKFKNHDTLFARITPCLENGRTGFVQFLPEDDVIALGSTEFIVLRTRTLNPYFVYLLAQTHDFRGRAIKSMTGTTGRQRVVNQCFDDYLLSNPDQDTLLQFECIIAPLFKKVQSLWERNINLRKTRDLLLPKLISGEFDVSDLEIDTAWMPSIANLPISLDLESPLR